MTDYEITMEYFDKEQNLLGTKNIVMDAEDWEAAGAEDGVVIASLDDTPESTDFVVLLNKTTKDAKRVSF